MAGVGRLVLEAHEGGSVPPRLSIFQLTGSQRLELLSLRDTDRPPTVDGVRRP